LQVAKYDLQPEMCVQAVADKIASIVKSKEYEFVMCNFTPPDMVRFASLYLGFFFPRALFAFLNGIPRRALCLPRRGKQTD
jgi:hypothetical protein